MFRIRVIVEAYDERLIADYVMDHDDVKQRRVLGEQCSYAFRAGQAVTTYAEDYKPCRTDA